MKYVKMIFILVFILTLNLIYSDFDDKVCGYDLVLEQGWNLVSIPVIGPEVNERLSDSDITLYKYINGKYIEVKTSEPFVGYWVNSKENQIIQLTGQPVCGGQIKIENTGWNLIGVPYGGFSNEQVKILNKYNLNEFYSYNIKTNTYSISKGDLDTKGIFINNQLQNEIIIDFPISELCAEKCRERPSTIPECGNSIIQTSLGENCDDGNTINWDGCSENCLIECGEVSRSDIMLVIDTSGSMREHVSSGETKIDVAKRAAQTFVNMLNPATNKVGVVKFHQTSDLVIGLSNNLILVNDNIEYIDAYLSGDTNIGFGINRAQREIETNALDESNHIIILLSDGADSSYVTGTIDKADRAKANGTLIYTIAFGGGADTTALRAISSGDGYYFYSSEDSEELESIYLNILGELPSCCGDSILNEGEDCDFLDPITMEGCTNHCTLPICGDGLVEGLEGCDPPGSLMYNIPLPNGTLVEVRCRDDCTFCGDNEIQNLIGETCDPDGSLFDAGLGFFYPCLFGCRACGDTIIQTEFGETCEYPRSHPLEDEGIGNSCREHDCTFCGDNITQTWNGEECDDYFVDFPSGDCAILPQIPNPIYSCQWAECGNGILDTISEKCDDPTGFLTFGIFDNPCREDCTYCGDDIWTEGEECDSTAMFTWMENCSSDCVYCGNGIVDVIHIDEDFFIGGLTHHINYDYEEECDFLDPLTPLGCSENCTVISFCGDNTIQTPNSEGFNETCDGELWCRDDCTYCGDNIIQDWNNETCELDETYCRGDCTSCGDETVNLIWDEECDDGDTTNYNECLNDCTNASCGDGFTQTLLGETCELSIPSCREEDCRYCGDGNIESLYEECDDANPDNDDECLIDCSLSFCGDSFVQAPNGLYGFMEECEPPGRIGCFNNCTLYPPIYCGDFDIDPGESCDPPHLFDGVTPHLMEPHNFPCRDKCSFCGDGTTQAPYGEECDDANSNQNDSCLNNCINNICGDGILNEQTHKIINSLLHPYYPGAIFLPYEMCEPSLDTNCREDCTKCGDGYIQPIWNETCEAPGEAMSNGNICGEDCTFCGDGIIQPTLDDWIMTVDGPEYIVYYEGENCDGEDYCRDDCTYCGDGIIQPTLGLWVMTPFGSEYLIYYEGETCEPILNSSCREDCTYCGDGFVDEGSETCDGESWCREDCTYCGDGVKDNLYNETCDDGNSHNTDSCLNNCERPYCGDGYLQREGVYIGESGEIVILSEECDYENVFAPEWCLEDCTFFNGCVDLYNESTYAGRVVNILDVYYIHEDTVLCKNNYTSNQTMIKINSSDVIFDCNGSFLIGAEIGGISEAEDIAVYNGGFNNVSIKNCNIKNFGYGIYFDIYSENGFIKDNMIVSNPFGILLNSHSSNNKISNNNVSKSHHGIAMREISNDNNVTNNIVFDNINGILIENSIHTNISDNTIYSNTQGIYVWTSDFNIIYNNNIYSNGASGILIGLYSKNNNILSNSINSNKFYGISIDFSSNNLISENTINRNLYDGINLRVSGDNIILNNFINSNNKNGIFMVRSSNNEIGRNTLCHNYADINITYNSFENYGDNICDNIFIDHMSSGSIICSSPCH